MARKKVKKTASNGKKTAGKAKKAVKRVVERAKKAVTKGAKKIRKAAKKVRARAASTREKARVRLADATRKSAPPPPIDSADAPPVEGKSVKQRGAARAGTEPRRRKTSPRLVGGVNLKT